MSIGMSTGTNAAAPVLGHHPRRASIGLELSKMRRLRTVPVAAALAAATVALSAANLFSASARAGFSSPDSRVWEELLLRSPEVSRRGCRWSRAGGRYSRQGVQRWGTE